MTIRDTAHRCCSALLLAAISTGCDPAAVDTPDTHVPVDGVASREVTINDRPVDDEMLERIESALFAEIPEGDYWYDARSGLGGPLGAQATVYAPGFDFGPVAADASAGTTDIFYNGRELPWVEATYVAMLFGIPSEAIASFAGRYILEANGDVYTESGVYLGNLAAQAASMGGGGGAGDGCTAVTIPSSAPNPTGVPQNIDVATGSNC